MASTAREQIIHKIKQALEKPVPLPFTQVNESIFPKSHKDMSVEFAENFTALQGKFSFCVHEQDFVQQLSKLARLYKWEHIYCREAPLKATMNLNGFSNFEHPDIASCDVAITSCEQLIARTGSILLSSAASSSGRNTSVYAPIHICVAYTSQLVYDISDGLHHLQKKYKGNLPSLISLATGPSRTADIEKTLVVGVHGPKQVFLFLIDNSKIS